MMRAELSRLVPKRIKHFWVFLMHLLRHLSKLWPTGKNDKKKVEQEERREAIRGIEEIVQ